MTQPGRQVGPTGVAALLAAGFALLAVVVERRGTVPGEVRALRDLHDAVGRSGEDVLVAVDGLTDVGPLAVVGAVGLAVLLGARRWRDAGLLTVGTGGVWVLNPVLKDLFGRPRPDLWPSPLELSQFAFPSGHAAGTAALVGALVLVLPGGRVRLVGLALGAAALLTVAAAQLVLGAHFPSDILAGWLWAGAWVAGVRALKARWWPARADRDAASPRPSSPL